MFPVFLTGFVDLTRVSLFDKLNRLLDCRTHSCESFPGSARSVAPSCLCTGGGSIGSKAGASPDFVSYDTNIAFHRLFGFVDFM
jgi:hypothetical protein